MAHDPASGNPEPTVGDPSAQSRLRLRDYFWRPWYARLWWLAAMVYWTICLIGAIFFPDLEKDVPETLGTWLMMAFHPYMIVPVLGFPLLWAWRWRVFFPWDDYPSGDDEAEPYDELYGGEPIGFHRSILRADPSHPADPLSPNNPSNPIYRRHHGKR